MAYEIIPVTLYINLHILFWSQFLQSIRAKQRETHYLGKIKQDFFSDFKICVYGNVRKMYSRYIKRMSIFNQNKIYLNSDKALWIYKSKALEFKC